ncbi:peroxidase [Musa troglodytarum]|uniref:Peroxidase n=1 Tax=Musa troglodytarum TaxID=320322 RepID=A0A9E7H3A3_9LILI|nr:peroxidase [Musa troglodytarum]
MNSGFLLLACVVLLGLSSGGQAGELKKHFYKKLCPRAEAIVQELVWASVENNSALPAKLLRLFFHDCFVRVTPCVRQGCDASVLLDSTANSSAEKDAIPNRSLAGFEVIDQVKAALEKACPGRVSCADILALAARDSVSFRFRQPLWEVKTGRRDGNVSLASEALADIPSAGANITRLVQQFACKNLSVTDLVVLSGAHTIGDGHCGIIRNRLYNFAGNGGTDPSLNATYAAFLKSRCSPTDRTTTEQPVVRRPLLRHPEAAGGLFQPDPALLTDGKSNKIVDKLLDSGGFLDAFRKSITRMGDIGVLTGTDGQIRSDCRAVNR